MATKQQFTFDEYEDYKYWPQWKLDFQDVVNLDEIEESAVEAYWVDVVDDWLRESREKFMPVKKQWAYAIRCFEQSIERMGSISVAQIAPEHTDLPFLYKAILDLVALLFDTLPRPTFQSKQSSEDDFVNGLNYFANWEMDAADFDMLMYDIGLDIQLCNLGILKLTVDKSLEGPFGQEGRIQFRRVEPRFVMPDPCTPKLDWKLSRYIGVAEPYDVGDLRSMYPFAADLIEGEAQYSTSRADLEDNEDEPSGRIISSPANDNSLPFSPGERQRALLKEFWFHDNTVRFVADLEKNEETGIEEPKVDEDGFVVGEWVKRFPKGRCVIVCGDVVLANFANPHESGQPPFVFFAGRPTKSALTPGDATFLRVVERKMNSIYKKIHIMAEVNTERPTIIDSMAFDAPSRWRKVSSMADAIIQVRNGSQVSVMLPGEIPQFVSPYLQFLDAFFSDLMGIQAVQRGQLTEGAQLSAQALGDLQDQAGTRSRMKARFIEAGLKNMGQLLQWLIRETYPSDFTIKMTDPDTKKAVDLQWKNQKDGDEYPVAIQAGSSLPGAKQGAYQQARQLYQDGIVDDEYVLACAQIPGADKIAQRTQQKALTRIETQSEGRALGLQIKEIEKQIDKVGAPPKE